MVKIYIKGLKDGIHVKKYRLSPEDLGLDPGRFSEVELKTILELHDGNIAIEYAAQTDAKLICDRTLDPFDYKIDLTERVFAFVKSDELRPDKHEEVIEIEDSESEIDLTNTIRDSILLGVPLRKVSPGAEDREIPTSFGKKKDEIDERWAKLKDLKLDE